MANICTNMLYVSTENKHSYDRILSDIHQTFECYYENEEDEMVCEMEFGSKWSFPKEEMEAITKKMEPDDSLYIRVLSYELACEYVGFYVFKKGRWIDKLNEN